MVDTTSKMCITATFVIVYLHATFHIKCAGMFINHQHITFHMPCSNCSLVTTIKLNTKEKFHLAIMLLTYNLHIYYNISYQVHNKCSNNTAPTSHFCGSGMLVLPSAEFKSIGY